MGHIFDLATSRDADVFVTAREPNEVTVWDLADMRPMRSFEAPIDLGGRRLALSPDGAACFAGTYYQYGLAAYEVATGQLIWQRRDLKKVQVLQLSPDGSRLYAELDGRALTELDAATGETKNTLRGVKEIRESPFANIQLRAARRLEVRTTNGEKLLSFPRENFAVLDATFSETMLLTSEAAGELRCFNLDTGAEAWRYALADSHALRVGYHEERGLFSAVVYRYNSDGKTWLVRFAMDGSPSEPEELPPSWLYGYAKRGSRLVVVGEQAAELRV
ncbi:MAG: WD40 repeat domain-containing protein [Fimbriimonas sp.]